MNRYRHSPSLAHLLTAAATLLVSGQYAINPVHAQSSQDVAGATTVSSTQKVSIIIDRERTPDRTLLLLKILVPQDARVESFALENPARIVVDFLGVSIKTSENLVPPKNSVIKIIRLGAHADKLRIVLDLSTPTAPQYEWRGGARQATLRIVESGATTAAAAPVAAPTLAPTVPQPQPTKAPTSALTPAPTPAPTKTPTTTPTSTPTLTPTKAPTIVPTVAPTIAPTTVPTNIPTAPPQIAQPSNKTEPKLPDMTEKELEEALDKEVARATQALERGEKLPEPEEFEGEDLVDVPTDEEEVETADLSQEKEPEVELPTLPSKAAGIATKDLPTGGTNQPPSKPDTLTGLRANPIPAAPVTEFTVQRAEFAFLEPEHKEAFRVTLSQGGAQAHMSKVDPTTYKIVVPKCGLANLGLALPQYPTADYKGILAATPKVEGDTVEITIQVEEGVSLTTLMRDKEVWIKRQ